MKEEILKLRAEGKTYRQIWKELGCSRSTISYYCGVGQKEMAKKRAKKYKSKDTSKIKRKIESFKSEKINDFKRGGNGFFDQTGTDSPSEFLKKLESNPYCYLTGKKIDLSMRSTYSLDHIIPVSKGGSNSIDNCGLADKTVNRSKTDMSVDEFIEMCKKVCENFGYKVIK